MNKARWSTCVIVIGLTIVGLMCVQDVHAMHVIFPFDERQQPICFQIDDINKITLDGKKNQFSKIRDMVNDAAQMFSAKTNMYIWETTCDFTQNTIRSYDYNNHYLDAVVLSHPEHEVPTSKHISFNIFENHPFSSTTDCHTLTQDPNLQYITNHEFGHFAGLYHVPENEDQNNDFMSDNCNRAYASLPQKYVKEINSLYPIIPSWIKANAQLWSSDQIDDATFTASLQYLRS